MSENKIEQSINRGSRCSQCLHCGDASHVGQQSPADYIKSMWHKETTGKRLTLKQFAKALVVGKDPIAKEWFANKRGAKNQKRSEANIARARVESAATKSARRGKKPS